MRLPLPVLLLLAVVLAPMYGDCALGKHAKPGKPKSSQLAPLDQYLQRIQGTAPQPADSLGSLWPAYGGPLTSLASDYKARQLNDIVIIRIVEQTLAQVSGTVGAQRAFTADSSVNSVGGQTVSYLNPLYSLGSNRNLKGNGSANSTSLLRTSVAGRVVAVLPNGYLVVEAERMVSFNQQNQSVVLRGLVRPGDIGSDNSVPSTSVSDLEVELMGKGVVSDAVRQPNVFVRWLTRLLEF